MKIELSLRADGEIERTLNPAYTAEVFKRLWVPIALATAGGAASCGGKVTDGSGSSSSDGGANGGLPASGGTSGMAGRGGSESDAAFAGVPLDWLHCTTPSDCTVRAASCCGNCGAATPTDAVAVHKSRLNDYRELSCSNVDGCDGCYMQQEPTLVATCRAGQCEVVDLLATSMTACSSNEDCRLRTGDCCECGGNMSIDALIAIRHTAELEYHTLVCDPNASCGHCMPVYPYDARAECFGGRCTVTGMPGSGTK